MRRVMAELKAAYADHARYDDWATRCLDFMGANSGLEFSEYQPYPIVVVIDL